MRILPENDAADDVDEVAQGLRSGHSPGGIPKFHEAVLDRFDDDKVSRVASDPGDVRPSGCETGDVFRGRVGIETLPAGLEAVQILGERLWFKSLVEAAAEV